MTFMTVGLAQLLHLGNARSRLAVLTRRHVVSNWYALGALVTGVCLQLLALYQPVLSRVLTLEPMGVREWVVVAALSLVPAVLGQASKVRRESRPVASTLW